MSTTSAQVAPLRSLLFCPATEERRVRKLPHLGADAVALDLEDAVSEDRKTAGRELARTGLETLGAVRSYVRVNDASTGRTQADIEAVVSPNLAGVIVPKVEDPQTVTDADAWITESERREGMPAGSVTLLVLLESGRGVHRAADILSASPRIETAIFGAVDFMLDVGINTIDHTPAADELLFARSAIVVAARVARRSPPLDGPFIDVTAPDAFLAQCRQARSLGFRGKMLIHPSQVSLAHEGFAPGADEVAAAHRIVEAFEAAETAGQAAVVVDGRLVDYPVLFRARRIIAAVR